MLVHVNGEQGRAILGAMRRVATAGNKTSLTDRAHRAITAASHVVFHESDFPAEHCPTLTPRDLATLFSNERQTMWAVRFLAVMARVDGVLDKDKIALVLECAAVL